LPGDRSSFNDPTAETDTISVTPSCFNASIFALKLILDGEIKFTEIPVIIEKACAEHHYIAKPTLEDLLELEIWATDFVNAYN